MEGICGIFSGVLEVHDLILNSVDSSLDALSVGGFDSVVEDSLGNLSLRDSDVLELLLEHLVVLIRGDLGNELHVRPLLHLGVHGDSMADLFLQSSCLVILAGSILEALNHLDGNFNGAKARFDWLPFLVCSAKVIDELLEVLSDKVLTVLLK